MAFTKQRAEQGTLSELLREGTSVNHREAERRPFMRVFFKGETPPEAYAEWMMRQWFIYDVLERTGEQLATHPVVGVMHTPALYRTAALARDLEVLVGAGWRANATPSPVTQSYVERIAWCANEFPPGWVAHQWLRYLGNVGGQEILRRLAVKINGFDPDGPGMDFFRYDALGEARAFFGDFHARMNSMPLDADTVRRVVAEGDLGFRLNMELTDELATDFGIVAPDGDPDAEYNALNPKH
jgi:heme oxygenase